MNLFKLQFIKYSLLFFSLTFILSSCGTNKKVTYFQDVPDSGAQKVVDLSQYESPKIQSDDILSVSIETLDQQITSTVNQTANTNNTSGSTGAPVTTGYLVSKSGEIEVSLIGKINVAGLTTYEAAEKIRSKADEYFKSPTVQVRFINYRVTVLGEVNHPGTFNLPNEKVSVVDALGLAGDLTIYGRRENVMIIRDVNGKKEFSRLNLNSSDIFKSQYFYLKQNDVLYIEANKARVAANNTKAIQITTVAVSILSLIVVLVTRL